ncbi:MAG: diguanylate cyclase [bacterium]
MGKGKVARGAAATEKDWETLRNLASELIADNAELKNRLYELDRELNLMYTVIRKVSYSLDWREIQEMIIDIVMEFFPVVVFGLIALFRPGSDRVTIRARRRGGRTAEAGYVLLPFRIDETTKWDEVVGTQEWSMFWERHGGLKQYQSSFIPLAVKEKQIGFLMIAQKKGMDYAEGEWRFLSTIAHHFAVALENSQLYLLAITDALTGLFNRRYFISRLEREIEKAMRRNLPVSLLMLDIDRFKRVNDAYGHDAGDMVLVELARRVEQISGENAVVCRYGGEEYLVMLVDVDGGEAFPVGEKLRSAMEKDPFYVVAEGKQVPLGITVSIGVSNYPADAQDAQALISRADRAMYLAKSQGRNRVA